MRLRSVLFLFTVSLFAIALVLCLAACNSEPAKPTTTASAAVPEKKEPAPLLGRSCLQRMSDSALRWQPDALPYHMESEWNEEATGQDGKATVWDARFVSMAMSKVKTFHCSGSQLKESPAFGVTSDREVPFTPGTTFMSFLPSIITIDTDKVFQESLQHGGAELMKKDPKQPVTYELAYEPKYQKVLWLASFGKNQKDSKGIAVFDASQGKYMGAFKR
jgi:hypothetical protein